MVGKTRCMTSLGCFYSHTRTLDGMDLEQYTPDDHARISNQVRIQLGDRLERMLNNLEKYVRSDDGEPPMPGHLQAYLTGIKLFGNLYQVEKPPRAANDLIEADKVEKLIEAARIAAAAETVELLNAQRAITSTAEFTLAARKLRDVLDGREDDNTTP